MLKFDFSILSDFVMLLDEKCITVETPKDSTVYQVEDWKRAYGDYFVAVADYLTSREEWAFAYDFLKTKANLPDKHIYPDCTDFMPVLELNEASSVSIIKDFDDIKRQAYQKVNETKAKMSGKKAKTDTLAKSYDIIVDEMAFLAMQKVWYLYMEKQLTLEQARDESIVVFREYRRLRLLLTEVEQYERACFETYQRHLAMYKNTTGLFLYLINHMDDMSDFEIINKLIDIICLQNGEGISGEVLRRKFCDRYGERYVEEIKRNPPVDCHTTTYIMPAG